MKSIKYVIYCCVAIILLIFSVVVGNINLTSASTVGTEFIINCSNEISVPVGSVLELDSSCVCYGNKGLTDLSVSITSNNEEAGLTYVEGLFYANDIDSCIVSFSLQNSSSVLGSITINVVENTAKTEYVLYVNEPQALSSIFDDLENSSLIYDEEAIAVEDDYIIAKCSGTTQITCLTKYENYSVYLSIDVELVAAKSLVAYSYTFTYVEDEVYTVLFELTSSEVTTQQTLSGIDYDHSLIGVIGFNAPLIQIRANCPCVTSIYLEFAALDYQVELELNFI